MKRIIPLLFAALMLVACSDNASAYNPYASREGMDISNKYEGDGNDFHLHHWYESEAGQCEVDESDELVNIKYTKNVNYEYSNVYTTVIGRFGDFEYLNFKAKGTPGKGVTFRMYYGEGETELHNVLGDDVSFSLNSEYSVHSLKVKDVYKTRMDLLTKVCIYPEIGLAGVTGEFSFTDVWFSKEMPEGSNWENKGVDSGDTSVTVNGWRTEGWTMYTLYQVGTKTGVRYTKAAEYAFIEKSIDIKEGDNGMKFVFENKLINDLPSVTCIRFMLRGDVSQHVVDVEYPYDLYYEAMVYQYDLTKESEVQPVNGITTLEFSLLSGFDAIGEHHENGYRLTLLIESHPDDDPKYKRYRNGEMLIHEVSTFYDEHFLPDEYSCDVLDVYNITRKDGVERNITYTNIKGDAYWPRVRRAVVATPGSTITVKIRNNGAESVKIGLHAGIFHDERENAQNNNFFALWEYRGHGAGGWLDDGNTFDIASGATYSASITKNRSDELVRPEDAIDSILFVIDSCYGDETLRSGDIDIVSVEID